SGGLGGGEGGEGGGKQEGEEERAGVESEGGARKDNRAAKGGGRVDPALGRRGLSHSPAAPRCLRTARYGRTMRDLRRTGRVPGGTGVSRPISASEMASEALSVVGRLRSTGSVVKAT